MSSMSDFAGPDGRVDWVAYRKDQKAKGDICYRCETYIFDLFHKHFGGPRSCRSCHDMTLGKGEVSHDSMIRCPECRHSWDAGNSELGNVLCDDSHPIQCPRCDHSFEIRITVTYTYHSPEVIVHPDPEPEPEESEEDDTHEDGE